MSRMNSIDDLKNLRKLLEEETFAADVPRIRLCSGTACTATGAYAPGGHSAYFLEAWNGRRWRLVTAPHPAGFGSGALNGTSCAQARCTAVGAWSGGPIYTATLAMAN